MVTAKKTSTPRTVAVEAAAQAKPVAVKKATVKKLVATVTPATVTAAPVPPVKSRAATKSKTSKAKPTAAGGKPALSAEQRNHYVEVAAFYIAERRGFVPGNPADDWCAAELEVDRLIASGHFN